MTDGCDIAILARTDEEFERARAILVAATCLRVGRAWTEAGNDRDDWVIGRLARIGKLSDREVSAAVWLMRCGGDGLLDVYPEVTETSQRLAEYLDADPRTASFAMRQIAAKTGARTGSDLVRLAYGVAPIVGGGEGP